MFATLNWKVTKGDEPENAYLVNSELRELLVNRTGKQLYRPGARIMTVKDRKDFNRLTEKLEDIAARYPDNFEFIIFLHRNDAIVQGGPEDPDDDPEISQIIN